jgi:hypothetical protein
MGFEDTDSIIRSDDKKTIIDYIVPLLRFRKFLLIYGICLVAATICVALVLQFFPPSAMRDKYEIKMARLFIGYPIDLKLADMKFPANDYAALCGDSNFNKNEFALLLFSRPYDSLSEEERERLTLFFGDDRSFKIETIDRMMVKTTFTAYDKDKSIELLKTIHSKSFSHTKVVFSAYMKTKIEEVEQLYTTAQKDVALYKSDYVVQLFIDYKLNLKRLNEINSNPVYPAWDDLSVSVRRIPGFSMAIVLAGFVLGMLIIALVLVYLFEFIIGIAANPIEMAKIKSAFRVRN